MACVSPLSLNLPLSAHHPFPPSCALLSSPLLSAHLHLSRWMNKARRKGAREIKAKEKAIRKHLPLPPFPPLNPPQIDPIQLQTPTETSPFFPLTPGQRPPPLQLNRIPDPQLVDEVVVFDARGTFGGEFVEGGLERVAEAFDQVGDDEEACAVETWMGEREGEVSEVRKLGVRVQWGKIEGGREGEGDEP